MTWRSTSLIGSTHTKKNHIIKIHWSDNNKHSIAFKSNDSNFLVQDKKQIKKKNQVDMYFA